MADRRKPYPRRYLGARSRSRFYPRSFGPYRPPRGTSAAFVDARIKRALTSGKHGDINILHQSVPSGTVAVGPTAAVPYQVSPGQGSTGVDFQGNSFNMEWFKINLHVVNANTGGTAHVRFIVVIDDQPVGDPLYMGPQTASSQGYQILADNSTISQLVPMYPRRFRVLLDRHIMLDQAGAGKAGDCVIANIPLRGEKVSVTKSATGLSTYQVNKQLQYYICANVSQVFVSINSSFAFRA